VNKAIKFLLIGFVALALLTGAFAGGYFVGYRQTPPALAETWNIIHDEYVDPVDDSTLMEGAIKGMLDTLPFGRNYYMDTAETKEFNVQLNGKYEGIGAYVDTTQDYLTIIAPISGSPAEKAGLLRGDKVIKIDGEDMTGVQPELARQKVLGPADSNVVLTIKRGDQEPFDVTITRAKIVIPLVESKMIGENNDIAYVKISSYGDTTDEELKKALTELMANNPKGLILDLRNNGGGLLNQAVAVLSEFLPKDTVVVKEQYSDAQMDELKTAGDGLAENIPMVVLINEGSASASEITAGALQDLGRAKLVGVKSFGKGSVQSLIALQDNEGMVGITIAKWLTPKGRQIDKLGLEPDVNIILTMDDVQAGRDPQLEAAIQTLLAVIGNTPLPTSMPTFVPSATPVP
jgi:carboxyl-terminal processing protease